MKMRSFIFLLLLLYFKFKFAVGQIFNTSFPCPSTFPINIRDECYLVSTQKVSWSVATTQCQNLEGRLTNIKSRSTFKQLVPKTGSNSYWTGMIQDLGRVLSSSGEWLRNREDSTDDDIFPFGPESLMPTVDTSNLVAIAFNGTALVPMPGAANNFYICEYIGKLCRVGSMYFIGSCLSFVLPTGQYCKDQTFSSGYPVISKSLGFLLATNNIINGLYQTAVGRATGALCNSVGQTHQVMGNSCYRSPNNNNPVSFPSAVCNPVYSETLPSWPINIIDHYYIRSIANANKKKTVNYWINNIPGVEIPGANEYFISPTKLNFIDARQYCLDNDAILAEPITAYDGLKITEFLKSINNPTNYYWIGMTDQATEGTYVFNSSGVIFKTYNYVNGYGGLQSYSNYHSGEPNGGASENCKVIWENYQWGDYNCGKKYPYALCQKGSSPENCAAVLHVSNATTINYTDLGLKTNYDLTSLPLSYINDKMFDVPCTMSNSFVCSMYFQDNMFYINATSISAFSSVLTGDQSAPWPACAFMNKKFTGIGSFSTHTFKSAEMCAKTANFYKIGWSFELNTGTCSLYGANLFSTLASLLSTNLRDGTGFVSGTCGPTLDRYGEWCEKSLGWKNSTWIQSTTTADNALRCIKVVTDRMSYSDAKKKCSSESFTVYGSTMNAQLADLSGSSYRSINDFLNNGLYWQPSTDFVNEGNFAPDPDVPNDRQTVGSLSWFDDFAVPVSEPNNGVMQLCFTVSSPVDKVDPPNNYTLSICNGKASYFCTAPLQEGVLPPLQINGQSNLCETTAISGDISCDFESSQWDNGFCNWQYDFVSSHQLKRVEAPVSDLALKSRWKYGNHYVTIDGPGYVLLTSSSNFKCENLHSKSVIGFVYQLSSEAQIRIGKIRLAANMESNGVIYYELFSTNVSTGGNWENVTVDVCNINDTIPTNVYWKFAIEITTNEDTSVVSLDDIGPCSIYEFFDFESESCISDLNVTALPTNWIDGSSNCSVKAQGGLSSSFDPWNFSMSYLSYRVPLVRRTAKLGLYSINALRQRPFTSLGSLLTESINISNSWDNPNFRCSTITCSPPKGTITKMESTDTGLAVACRGHRSALSTVDQKSGNPIKFQILPPIGTYRFITLPCKSQCGIWIYCTNSQLQGCGFNVVLKMPNICDPINIWTLYMNDTSGTLDVTIEQGNSKMFYQGAITCSYSNGIWKNLESYGNLLLYYTGDCFDPSSRIYGDYCYNAYSFANLDSSDLNSANEFCQFKMNLDGEVLAYDVKDPNMTDFVNNLYHRLPLLSKSMNIIFNSTSAPYTLEVYNFEVDTICQEDERAVDCSTNSTFTDICIHSSTLGNDGAPLNVNKYLGCGLLANSTPVGFYNSNFMTIQFCVEVCRGSLKNIAAVSTINCFCFDDIKNVSLVPTVWCNRLCPGNPNQVCGGIESLVSMFNVAAYSPLASSCIEFYKFGIFPNHFPCLILMDLNQKPLNCCWNNLVPSQSPCSDSSQLGLGGICYTFPAKINQETSLSTCTESGFGGQLAEIGSTDELDLLGDILMYSAQSLPIKKGWLVGSFTNPFGLYSTATMVEKTYLDFQLGATNKSCLALVPPTIPYSTQPLLKKVNCLQSMDGICEYGSPLLGFRAYQNPPDMYLNNTIVGFFNHPMNSVTACSSLCAAKSQTKTIFIYTRICICSSKSIQDVLGQSPVPATCAVYQPCPGNPMEQCGCRLILSSIGTTYLISDASNLDVKKFTYKSCDDLKASGVFVNGFYLLDGNSNPQYCKLWDSICPDGWELFRDSCTQIISNSMSNADVKASGCVLGKMAEDPTLGFWAQSNGFGNGINIWGKKSKDGSCNSAISTPLNCSDKHNFACNRPVCRSDEIIIGGYCVYYIGSSQPLASGQGSCKKTRGSWLQPKGINSDHLSLLILSTFVHYQLTITPDKDGFFSGISFENSTFLCWFFTNTGPVSPFLAACPNSAMYFCFRPVICPPGSQYIPGSGDCFIQADLNPVTPQVDFCISSGAYMPAITSKAFASSVLSNSYKKYTTYSSSNLSINYEMSIGAHIGPDSPSILTWTGSAMFSSYFLQVGDLLNSSYKMPFLSYNSSNNDTSVFSAINSSTSQIVCDVPFVSSYCIDFPSLLIALNKSGETFLKNSIVTSGQLSSHSCIQFCKGQGAMLSLIWQISSVTNCSCHMNTTTDLFSMSRSTNGLCSPDCSGQVCGITASSSSMKGVAVFDNTFFLETYSSCEQAFTETSYPPMPNQLVNVTLSDKDPQTSDQVQCMYSDYFVCQSSLISTVRGTILTIDNKIVTDLPGATIRKWFSNSIPNVVQVQITFSQMVLIKYVYTAWMIDSIKYSNSMSPQDIWNATVPGSENMTASFPTTLSFDKLIIANAIGFNLHMSRNQKSPYFELRGCNLEDDSSLLQTRLDNTSSVHVIANGTLYEISKTALLTDDVSAIAFCEQSNGTLAVIDTQIKQNVIQNLISRHFVAFSNGSKVSYLLGLKRLNKIWTYSSNTPLGSFMNWAAGEPTYYLDCVVITMPSNATIANQTWSSHHCSDMTGVVPVCEFPVLNLEIDLPYRKDCAILNDQNWQIMDGAKSVDECKSYCSSNSTQWQWVYFENNICQCIQLIEYGFWPTSSCSSKTEDVSSGTIHRIFNVSCDKLVDLPDKFAYLRQYHKQFFIGSRTTYECMAGYKFPSGNTSLELQCQPNGNWSIVPTSIDACVPITCPGPSMISSASLHWNISYMIYHQSPPSTSTATTSFILMCDVDRHFVNMISNFTATCGVDGLWHLSHPVGCPGYVKPADITVNDTASATCENMSLQLVDCDLPLCPMPNDTKLSLLDTENSNSKLISQNVTRKADTVIQFQCATPFQTFRNLDEDSPIDILNVTCLFNVTTKLSVWKWTYNGIEHTGLPICNFYCKNPPPSDNPPIVNRTWDNLHWKGSSLSYKCQPEMAFSLSYYVSSSQLYLQCVVNNATNATDWMFLAPDQTWNTILPECNYLCSNDPLEDPKYNRTWTKGVLTVNTKARYVCPDPDKVFMSRQVYTSIDLQCMRLPNKTTGDWFWNDEGKLVQTLPPCQKTPQCTTIQEQMDPSQPFNAAYVVHFFDSYVKVTGDYVNGTVPITSKVNLSCFYNGEQLRINDVAYSEITMECIFYPDRGNASWTWFDPVTNGSNEQLPLCSNQCLDQPLNRVDLKRSWSGLTWVGEVVNYTCRSSKKLMQVTNGSGLAFAQISCKEFGGIPPWWTPNQLPNCTENLVINTTAVLQTGDSSTVQLPVDPPNLATVQFAATTIYYWPEFNLNATYKTTYKVVSGPFQFGNALQLNKSKSECFADERFIHANDQCFRNLANCPDGLSLSLFYQVSDPTDSGTPGVKEFILSTGGEIGTPGVGIFFNGVDLGVTLCAENLTWSLLIAGQRPGDANWYNIAIRWKMPNYKNASDFATQKMNNVRTKDMGGLEVFVNMMSIGYVLLPDEVGCAVTNPTNTCPANSTYGQALDPPEVLLGCHKTQALKSKRYFASGIYDEVAFWPRRLNDTELPYFLGGYKSSLENVALNVLLQILQNVNMSNSGQANTAISVVNTLVQGADVPQFPTGNVYDTTTQQPSTTITVGSNLNTSPTSATSTVATTTTTAAPVDKASTVKQLIQVMFALTNSYSIPQSVSTSLFEILFNVALPVGEIMSLKGKYEDGWNALISDPSKVGAPKNRKALQDYLVTLLKNRAPNYQGTTSYDGTRVTSNFGVQLKKMTAQEFGNLAPAGADGYFTFPNWEDPRWNSFLQSSGEGLLPIDSVQVPTNIFTGSCKTQNVNFMGSIFDTFPDPGRKNPVNIPANHILLDSRVITVNITADPVSGIPGSCFPDDKLLLSYPLTISMGMTSQYKMSQTSSRKLKFHDENPNNTVVVRYCVIWNDDLFGVGGWDPTGIKSIYSDNTVTNCFSNKLGTYAVIAQLEDVHYVPNDDVWLIVIKIIGYILSFILLTIFIVAVYGSAYLWEMFHIIGMNLAAAIFLADVFMCLSELDVIRSDRHSCASIGILIDFFYTASSIMLMMESHAVFRATTTGIIGGKTKGYLFIGWGIPFIAVGLNIYLQLVDMGDDPRCMVGWSSLVKWFFFVPVLCAASFSLLSMMVVMCNLQAPALRKKSLYEDHSSLAKGHFILVFLYSLCWALAPEAYINFPGLELPNFYPAFQVLNSFMGAFVFFCIGVGSKKFRKVAAERFSKKAK